MQIATIQLALGGDKHNTIHKYDVTPAEVAVLRLIHGDDAVTDIHPHGEVERQNRAERQRLAEVYGRRSDNGRVAAPAVDALFPGVASRVFETFEELELPSDFFKAATRVSADVQEKPAAPAPQAAHVAPAVGLGALTVQQLREYATVNHIDLAGAVKKPAIIAAIEAAEAAKAAAQAASDEAGDDGEDDAEDDGIGEMDDANKSTNLFQ